MSTLFDLAVVGGGHAGCEAALVAARSGLKTALVTLRLNGIGQLSCNPAMGGLAKGHLVRELDALGGHIGLASDRATLFRHTLNLSRGSAVRGTRAQVDRFFYGEEMGQTLRETPHLTLIEGRVDHLMEVSGRCTGLRLGDGSQIDSRAVVLTTGTFLGAICHRGDWTQPGGRIDETEVDQGTITAQLKALGLRTLRLKTGTCPRLDRESINFDQLKIQTSDLAGGFSDHPEAQLTDPGHAGQQAAMKRFMTWYVKTSTDHRFVVKSLMPWGLVTARVLKTRWNALPIERVTNSFSNPKESRVGSCIWGG